VGVFLVKFVIIIPSFIMVLKHLHAPPSFSMWEGGWGICFWSKSIGNTLRFCRWYFLILRLCFILCKFQYWSLTILSFCVFVILSLCAIPSWCIIIFYLYMQYLHCLRDNLHRFLFYFFDFKCGCPSPVTIESVHWAKHGTKFACRVDGCDASYIPKHNLVRHLWVRHNVTMESNKLKHPSTQKEG
jgi:hypothetical protein